MAILEERAFRISKRFMTRNSILDFWRDIFSCLIGMGLAVPLRVNEDGLALLWRIESVDNFRDERNQILQAIAAGTKDQNGDIEPGKILLKGQVAVDGDKNVEVFFRFGK